MGFQEAPGHLVRGEEGRGRPQLGAHVADGRPASRVQSPRAWAEVLHDPAHSALDREPAQKLQDDVLARNPGGWLACQADAHDPGIGQVEGLAGHGRGHVQTAGPDGQLAQAAGGRGVAVRAKQSQARNGETLQMDLVADAVARTGEIDPEALGRGPEKEVVVSILGVGLEKVVIDVADRRGHPDPLQPQGLELQVSQGAGGVLGQGLVYGQADGLALLGSACDHVLGDYPTGQAHASLLTLSGQFSLLALGRQEAPSEEGAVGEARFRKG